MMFSTFASLGPLDNGVCLLSVAGGVISAFYLHRFPMRGDTGLFVEFVLAFSMCSLQYVALHTPFYEALWTTSMAVMLQIVSLVVTTLAYRISPFHPLSHFSGPLLHKLTNLKLAHVVWTGKRYLHITRLHAQYGPIIRTGPNTLSLNTASAQAVSALYASSNAFEKSAAYNLPGRGTVGKGLFFMRERGEHRIRRKAWAKGFGTGAAMDGYAEILDKRVGEMMECAGESAGKDGSLDWTDFVQRWSFDCIGEVCLGDVYDVDLLKNGDPNDHVKSGVLSTALFETLGEVPTLFDVIWYLSLVMPAAEGWSDKLIERRIQNPSASGKDLSSYLLGEHGNPSNISVDDFKLDIFFALTAGTQTTSTVLVFLFYYLLRDKESYSRLRSELDDAFPDSSVPLDQDVLAQLPFLSAVCEESLRLGSPFGGLPRVVNKGGVVLDGTYIPEDTVVSIPPWACQTSPENFWPAPQAFLPQRWMPGGLGPDSILNKRAMLSFSQGPFGCLGRTLAYKEIRLVVAQSLLTFDLELSPTFDNNAFLNGIENMRATFFRYPLLVTPKKRVMT